MKMTKSHMQVSKVHASLCVCVHMCRCIHKCEIVQGKCASVSEMHKCVQVRMQVCPPNCHVVL